MDAMVARPAGGPSLLDRGYRYVNLDDGIVLKNRTTQVVQAYTSSGARRIGRF
jgi:hypothetical protein